MRLRGFLLCFALCAAGCSQPPESTGSRTPAPAASPTTSPSASPTSLAQSLEVPDSTPVILFHDAVAFDQLDGMTWDAATQGRVGMGVANGGSGTPQGTLYATTHDIRNRTGQVVSTYDPTATGIFWADDGRSFCDVTRTASRDIAGPGMLQIAVPGQAARNVAQVGMFGPATSNAGGPAVIACSPSSDRAVVYQSGGQGVGVAAFWVVQLSSGRTVFSGGSGGWITASHDGHFVALSPSPGVPTNIYGENGGIQGQWPQTVFGFSWDGSLVVAAGSFGDTPSIVRWRDQDVVWKAPSDQLKYWQTFAEPGGTRIAVGVLDPAFPQTGGFAPVDLFVVGADGTTVLERKDITLFGQ